MTKIQVNLGGMNPGHAYIEPGTRLTPETTWGKSQIWKNKNPRLIHCKEDNNGSIIIIEVL